MSGGRARVFQVVPIAAATCVRCGTHLRDSSLLIRSDGGLRCKKCTALNYGVYAPTAGFVLLCIVTPHELQQINRMADLGQVLDYLGLAVPCEATPVMRER